VQALADGRYDVYLVDYRLGARTGLEFLQEAVRCGVAAPMIMLTGQREREVDLLSMRAGAVDYLVKDRLDAAKLDRSIRYALQQKRHEEEIRQANQRLEERVVQRTAELAAVNETLQTEIAVRKQAEEALRAADRRKDQFLATLAHELRNPLSPLLVATQLIGMEPTNATQVRELAGVMSRQLEQLVRLIDDLLDVSRISSGKLRLRREPVTLGEAIATALDVSKPLIAAARHQLHVTLPPEPLVIDGDKVRLTQIVGNLLINAAKYTPRGGRIELQVRGESAQAVIRVRDNGLGIAAEMQSQIFNLFTQVDDSKRRSQSGLGIGLTLAKSLVEMHGGTIEVASDGPGKGSEFIVRLPLADPNSLPPRAATASDLPHRVPAIFRILIVDDNQSASYLLSRLLIKLNQQVRVESSAAAALAAVPDYQPEIVISDIAMPELSGYQLARKIRDLPEIPQPVLVALTGYGQESDRQEALAAGFDRHLTKPIGLPELERLLGDLSPPSAAETFSSP
jgi:signal transduction histidine kinase